MMLVERPGYRIDSRTIKRGSRPSIVIVSFMESSNLHPCNHLYWFLFVSYRGVVLVLVVLVMTRLSSPKTVCICVFFCGFGVGDFVGSSVRKIYFFHLFAKSPLLVCLLQRLLLSSSFQQNWFHFLRTSIAKETFFGLRKRAFKLSPIGFIISCWTMMFLCIILLCSL